jgi:hypothetical protein
MPPRVTTTRVCRFLIAVASCLLAACSSSNPQRDRNYGTDVAVGFVAPDGGVVIMVADAAPAVDGAAGGAADVGAVEAGVEPDAVGQADQ